MHKPYFKLNSLMKSVAHLDTY